METYIYKWTFDSVLLDHHIGSRNKYAFMLDIFKHSPDLIDGFLPFFKYELQINNKEVRYEAVSMFAKLFSIGPINLAVREPELWELYLQRFYDRYLRVRMVCVKSSANIVARWPDLFDDLMSQIAEIQSDSSFKIRHEVILALNRIAMENVDLVSSNNEFWEVLKTRTRDVKSIVRKEVRSTLIKLYKIQNRNSRIKPLAEDQDAWIIQELQLPASN